MRLRRERHRVVEERRRGHHVRGSGGQGRRDEGEVVPGHDQPRRVQLAPGQQELQAPDAVGDDAPEDVGGGIVDALGEQAGEHRRVG